LGDTEVSAGGESELVKKKKASGMHVWSFDVPFVEAW
jgi:hypothetical protein